MAFEVVRMKERGLAVGFADDLHMYLLRQSKHPYLLLGVYRTVLSIVLGKRLIWERSPERILWLWLGSLLPYTQPLYRRFRPVRSIMMFFEVMVKIERLDADVSARDRIGTDLYENLSRQTAAHLERAFCPSLSRTEVIALLKSRDQGEDRPWQTTEKILEDLDNRTG